MMRLLMISTGIIILSGFLSLVFSRSRASSFLGSMGCVLGCLMGLFPILKTLDSGEILTFHCSWSIPYGAFSIEVDALSAFFLIPIFVVSGLAALYGTEYLRAWFGKKNLGVSWFFFNILVISMVFVVIARNALLFLMAWEVMSIASFFLVTFENEKREVREAGWTYLVAAHLGMACLLVLFILMGREVGSMNFQDFQKLSTESTLQVNLLFVLALIGFGTKAGFIPFHVWLPQAHPAAPSHVSALMSGVMIKTGIYGLLRFLPCLGVPLAWWGYVLIGMGLVSGIWGILFALAQQDLKRLLAYSSVENVGVISLGLGLGILGRSFHTPILALLGFGGAIFHVLNHALFKTLLFLGAGAVVHGTHTRGIDNMGGLLKRMPWTGGTFLVGAVAISGLPPLNGFVSEFLIYLGGFKGLLSSQIQGVVSSLGVIVGTVLIGGFAAMCFTKTFGIIFLGEARSEHASLAHDPGFLIKASLMILAILCFFVSLSSPFLFRWMIPVLSMISGLSVEAIRSDMAHIVISLKWIVLAALILLGITALLAIFRKVLLRGRSVETALTWGCGYVRPSARMQYTGSSFVQPVTSLWGRVLNIQRRYSKPQGIFPKESFWKSEIPDLFTDRVYRPIFRRMEWILSKLKWLQHGHVQYYVLYIALTLLILLIWKL